MRKLLLFLGALPLMAQTPLGSLLPGILRCAGTAPQVIGWNGKQMQCLALGTGLSIVNGTLTIALPAQQPPAYQVETISLTSLAATATTVTYTTAMTPIGGAVLWWYSSANISMLSSGATAWTGQPFTVALPAGWLPADTITVFYRSQ